MTSIAKNFHMVILGIFGFLYFMDYQTHLENLEARGSSLGNIESNIAKNNQRLKKLKEFRENLEISKKRLQEVAEQINLVQKQLPTSLSDTRVMDFFADEAKKINIYDIQLTPKEEELNGFYFSKKFDLEGVGTFLQFLVLFERLYTAERLFNIETVNLKENTKDKQKGRFFLVSLKTTIESYRYNPEHKEGTGIEEIEQKYTKPVVDPKAKKAPTKRGGGADAE
ncbi:MAG: type 4a pilus biogenesis protein PilO [Bacteriovoracaceae bacterium]|nr:type 4a pilus biogenesis protein PilO [Bacteriovoracaceae bacterium]